MSPKNLFCFLMMVMVAMPTRAEDANPLDTIVNSSKEKKFTGSPITLKLKEADINEVMRLISEASGFNVVLAPGVSGKVTVSLEDVPWDQALDVVMTSMNLAAERYDSVLRVLPRDALLKEKQALIDAEKIAIQSAPRITRVFPISYADLTELSGLLKGFLSTAQAGSSSGAGESGASAAAAAPAAGATSIQIDKNTQSLIVRDTAEGVERIRKMIALLDVQTPQIIIEGKVIEASEAFSTKIDGNFSMRSGASSISINGALAGSGSAASPYTNAVRFGIGSALSLNAELSYFEGEDKAKVISSPRVMVLSGKSATITQGSNLPVSVQSISNGVVTETIQFIPYETSLKVTPRATNDGSVFMKLDLKRDLVQISSSGAPPAVAPRNILTEVVVDSGNTLVLGGVQNSSENNIQTGMPILRKLPLVGWLFGKEDIKNEKVEIMFFLTPRILNVKKTAMGDTAESDAPQASAPL